MMTTITAAILKFRKIQPMKIAQSSKLINSLTSKSHLDKKLIQSQMIATKMIRRRREIKIRTIKTMAK
jgi:hypothetical protein